MNQKRLFISLVSIVLLYTSGGNATIVIQGDVKDGITSFSFPIKAYATNYNGSNAYIGANEAGHKEYALCKLAQNEKYVLPIASEKVRANGLVVSNPIYDSTVSLLAIMNQDERIIVVTTERPASIFAVDNVTSVNNIQEFGIEYVFDASGTASTNGIIALGAEATTYVFAAVTDNAGNPFGQTGSNSGIAVLVRKNDVDQTKTPPIAQGLFFQIDAQPGDAPTPTARRAALFDGTLAAIKINSDATILNGSINLIVNNLLKSVYIGTQVQAGSNATDGARSVLIANVIEGKLVYKAIAPDAAFSAGIDNIVGTIGANASISCFKARSMVTTTDLTYLIVHGGVEGTSLSTQKTVYALPLVFAPNSEANGTLAKKDAIPVEHFSKDAPYRIEYHAFEDQAVTPDDLLTATDPAATVGNGELEAGVIADIFVKNDAVFAIVSTPDTGYLSGLFYSRALFDAYGRIKCWTTWQRVMGDVSDTIFGAFTSYELADFAVLTGTTESTINTIKRTSWGPGDANGMNPLATLVQKTFSPDIDGVRNMQDFSAATPSLDGISLIIGTGSRKILIAQTAYTTGGILTPLAGTTLAVDPLAFTAGTITTNFPAGNTNAISISGGDLDLLNPIVTADIGQTGTNGWLFVGGIGGLAVLADATGAGWTTLGDKFAGLTDGMAFKRIGNYSYVRKIMYDNDNLYVLADNVLDRIDLASSDFATGALAATTIATAEHLGAQSLTDFVVSDSFALLGTTNGLFELGQNSDWFQISLPEGLGCISQIAVITQTNRQQDVALNHGGNIYVLDTDPGKNRAMTHRFTVTPSAHGIELTLLPDVFVKDIDSYFIEFDGMRSWIVPDGDYLYSEHNRTYLTQPTISVASSALRSGVRLMGNNHPIIYTTPQGEFFARMIRNSATGALLLPTDQGLTCQE